MAIVTGVIGAPYPNVRGFELLSGSSEAWNEIMHDIVWGLGG